jgi:two-component system, response regulator PdtaR
MVATQLRVLVVENHQLLAVGLELLLTQLGHKAIEVVATGEEAIIAAERHRPDLILMDIGLDGDMDGIDAAQKILNRFGIRSLFFTGVSDPDTRARAALADPVAFLDKTSSKAELGSVISAFGAELSRRSTRAEALSSPRLARG